ncbi:MAG: bifunctional 2-C-methyl-D-erythritol 4-phosphate cytidylyltransferase/2-C-methyl-D-erythritol 2,4-cyclodiphosphate synthase [Parvibaculum sp.]|uniref:bifunctional 2-C-methyl-D-erythritol 4-phosphate cytidylyltransferase/2-C-methyl-D-erythritol 2,4-cyclodiphosphate synthase n=1 Tax=Parvibaculum sp. TaxID=2024848 RepID=UPI0025F90A50|nr:bifunctional 2-C-methyl-D-erythritol 4-phosphate cytidylyltransferase/2-C-methyl-D-erythritol 2,4-cyclodiphosphate synthase [Parvibaculum sp.]MCE9649211.1 bifunctional 2-C-methyl-D-erythritol 4-phosphate cytidylyltransferase/2-C-methyl-D-erythritol 2,4-cyclodiphosphate synthase [Parvibaculum sp.]
MTVAALIMAAGRGTRAGPGGPKQYRLLAGEPVLRRTLAAFAAHPGIDRVIAVIHPDDRDAYEAAAAGLPKLGNPCLGGETRQASVRLGLEALSALSPTRVLIHDGARPLVSPAIISRSIEALDAHQGALVALPVTDTVRRAANGLAGETIPREGLWRAQTPQAFHFAAILDAHRKARDADLTDDVAVAAAAGMAVAMIEGDEVNMKITSADDLARAERLIAGGGETRTGFGYDVHRFGPGDHVTLCGVRVAHTHGLVGHSDADAGLHALTDAILGAIGQGDIGQHFPPSDPQWKGASSDRFLAHAVKLAGASGARVVHVDVTFICERPKIGPVRDAMRARVAEILGLAVERVSIKATTTEGLGFTGRNEGLAAQALATLSFR